MGTSFIIIHQKAKFLVSTKFIGYAFSVGSKITESFRIYTLLLKHRRLQKYNFFPKMATLTQPGQYLSSAYNVIKLGTHLSTHRSTSHRIALVCQCGQHKRPEAYAPNTLMRCADMIGLLLVHQHEHYFVCAQCGPLFCHLSCLSNEQAYFILF